MAKAREVPGLKGGDEFRVAAAKVVGVRAAEVFEHASGVLDTDAIERVHDMRVATRRLRAVLEIFAPCFPRKLHRQVLRDVKRLADALGERRDPDVQIAALERYAAEAPAADRPGVESLLAVLRERQAGANRRLGEALVTMEQGGLRSRLQALVAEVDGA
jgi:CHAD domain-containing protein